MGWGDTRVVIPTCFLLAYDLDHLRLTHGAT